MHSESLLVELFVEELPPKSLQALGNAFAQGLFDALQNYSLLATGALATPFASPRRLSTHISNVKLQAQTQHIRHKLMPARVGLDAAGQPTAILLNKIKSLGIHESALAQLQKEHDGKHEVLWLSAERMGVPLMDALQQSLPRILADLPIAKMMSYQLNDGWTSVNFVRPVHRLVVLHGSTLLPVQVLGLTANRLTEGHRFEASTTPLSLDHADDYESILERQGAVIPSFVKRRAEVVRQMAVLTQAQNLQVHDDADLLDEVTALVERPNVLRAEFDQEFLSVPPECLILTMKANQKYFPLFDAQDKLSHQFLIVSNLSPADPSAIIEGNQRVVRSRLSDAKFFYEQDLKTPLVERVQALDKVVYHPKLGTQAERACRVEAIAVNLAQRLTVDIDPVRQATQLAKADLLTQMVGEFPELQGVMGRYYALHDGYDEAVADAISDHYKPRFAGDSLPSNSLGVVLALADKLEVLLGLFAVGEKPSGDKDPYALRRHALGVVRLLIEKDLPIGLEELFTITSQAFERLFQPFPDVIETFLAFIQERLASYLRGLGYHTPEINAALNSLESRYLNQVPALLVAVRAFNKLPEASALASANKRIINILSKAGRLREDLLFDASSYPVTPELLVEAAEQALYLAWQSIAPQANQLVVQGDYTASLQKLATFKAPVDAFFQQVLVNAEDEETRTNRLNLLANLYATMNKVADLSCLVT